MVLITKPGKRPLSLRLRGLVIAVLAASACACGTQGSGSKLQGDDSAHPPIVVLSAFPAELAPLVEQSTIYETMELEGRVFRMGRLGRVPVVLGLTGIGLANAAVITRAVLEKFEVRGVVVSGVAGSPLRIGDVAVPEAWALMDGPTFSTHQEWLELVDEIAVPGNVSLEHCTRIPVAPSREPVCLPHEPAIVQGGIGQSSDPFCTLRFPCLPNGGDVFGCDIASEDTASEMWGERYVKRAFFMGDPDAPVADDMETAAIAREAAAHDVPFIAFRAVSDGEGDPLGLPGFPAQFFAYYRLAACNAAAATVAFLERVAHDTDPGW